MAATNHKPMGASDSRANSGERENLDSVSVPLYLAGLVVSLVGLVAVNKVLEDQASYFIAFSSTTYWLTVIGYCFSIACRTLKVKTHFVRYIVLAMIGYLGLRWLTHSFDLNAIIPPGSRQGDLVMAIVLEWLTVCRSWMLDNDEALVFSSIPSVAMIGLVGVYDLNSDLLVYFGIYMLSATFLLLHHNYLVHRSWASADRRDQSESRSIKLHLQISVAMCLVALILGTALIVPVRAVGSHLSLANALKSLVGAAKDTSTSTGNTGVDMSDGESFEIGTGDGYSNSDAVLLQVNSSDHQGHYWRGRTYDAYEGGEWRSTLSQTGKDLRQDAGPVSGQGQHYSLDPRTISSAGLIHSHVEVRSGRTDILFEPQITKAVDLPSADADTTSLGYTQDNCLTIRDGPWQQFAYDVYSVDYEPTYSQLRHAAGTIPPEIRRLYIDQKGEFVPVADKERLMTTALSIVAKLPANRRTQADRAEAIRSWVSQQAVYTLTVGAVPSGQDAVSYFLFTSKQGYCDLFASAMAVLCRYAGIPARIATGVDSGSPDAANGYDLREMDKHAWVEVYFPGIGPENGYWNVYDPTAGTRTMSTQQAVATNQINALQRLINRLILEINLNGPVPILMGVLVVLGLGYVAKVEILDRIMTALIAAKRLSTARRTMELDSPQARIWSREQAHMQYRELERLMARCGLKRQPTMTHYEYANYLSDQFTALTSSVRRPDIDAPALVSSIGRLTELEIMAAYLPAEADISDLIRAEFGDEGESALKAVRTEAGKIKRFATLSRLRGGPMKWAVGKGHR